MKEKSGWVEITWSLQVLCRRITYGFIHPFWVRLFSWVIGRLIMWICRHRFGTLLSCYWRDWACCLGYLRWPSPPLSDFLSAISPSLLITATEISAQLLPLCLVQSLQGEHRRWIILIFLLVFVAGWVQTSLPSSCWTFLQWIPTFGYCNAKSLPKCYRSFYRWPLLSFLRSLLLILGFALSCGLHFFA